jgi:hypothetical protein
MEIEISIEGLFEAKHAEFGLLEKENCAMLYWMALFPFFPFYIIPSCQLCLTPL